MQITELKELLSRFHIRPDKKLGQNFLLSEKALDEIIQSADLDPSDRVLEIGPGLGVLTRKLADHAGVVLAVEKDKKIYFVLKKLFKNKKNVRLINQDALWLDLSALVRGMTPEVFHGMKFKYKLVANIPYYITGKLLQNFLTTEQKPSLMVLLLQKEVAERITARPGDMSILGISVQFYGDAEIVSYVPRQEFYPVPAVDSAILKINLLASPRLALDEKKFFHLVKIGFSNKRKQLHNNLSAGLVSLPLTMNRDFKEILGDLTLNPLCRAEDLSIEDWGKLYHKLNMGNL